MMLDRYVFQVFSYLAPCHAEPVRSLRRRTLSCCDSSHSLFLARRLATLKLRGYAWECITRQKRNTKCGCRAGRRARQTCVLPAYVFVLSQVFVGTLLRKSPPDDWNCIAPGMTHQIPQSALQSADQ